MDHLHKPVSPKGFDGFATVHRFSSDLHFRTLPSIIDGLWKLMLENQSIPSRLLTLLTLCQEMTMLTIFPGTTMILRIVLPSIQRCDCSCSTAIRSISSRGVFTSISRLKRAFPLNEIA